jgi:16S rRNA (guanine(527)-N(7))-methyltransferase RsmG
MEIEMETAPITLWVEGAKRLGVSLSADAIEKASRYLDLLIRWNRKINLTGTRSPQEIVVRHFLDSLTPLLLDLPDGRWADVGTGAGFPGLILKIVRPALSMTLIEVSEKKVAFLLSAIGQLGLPHTPVICDRLERLPMPPQGFDILTSRAVSPGDVILHGRRLLRPGGSFLFFQSQSDAVLLEKASCTGVTWEKTKTVLLPHTGYRSLVMMTASPSKLP